MVEVSLTTPSSDSPYWRRLLGCLIEFQNLVKVRGERNRERVVPHAAQTGKLLSRWGYPRGAALGVTLASERSEKVTLQSLHKPIERIGVRAGVADCYPHCRRHSAAIMMLRNRMDPPTVYRFLGHSASQMNMRYVALITADVEHAHATASPVMSLLRSK